jgi:sugar transferase (PEP-CTERM/EpsH1 system associated)
MHLVYSFGFGGMEVGVAKLTNAIDPSIVLSSICSCRPSETLKTHLRPEIRFFEIQRRPGWYDVRLIPQLYRLLRRERPDILHTHGWATLCEGLMAAALARVPIVVHGEHGTLRTRWHQALAQRWVWSRVDQVLAVSSELRERMARDIGFRPDRVQVIRNGVDTDRFHPGHRAAARASFSFDPGRIVLGTVGRLVSVKDHATLLRAWALLRSRGHAFTGLIAGRGPLHDQLVSLAASLGLDDVRFLGVRPDIEQVLAAMDVFVLSSRSEGLSNTIQEAMATGLPVVATRVGGAHELVVPGETGLLVPAEAPEAMADAIELLITDAAERSRMAEAGRRRAEQEFALSRMVREYVQTYIELATITRATPDLSAGPVPSSPTRARR